MSTYRHSSIVALLVAMVTTTGIMVVSRLPAQTSSPTFPCSDSDGGNNLYVKGVTTGIHVSDGKWFNAIYGQEPNQNYPKITTDDHSTWYDYCTTQTQLQEAFCDADGYFVAYGNTCPSGCSDGACKSAPQLTLSALGVFDPTQTNATIRWTTDGPATTQVHYGTTSSYTDHTQRIDTLSTTHVQVLNNLMPGTAYHFLAESVNGTSIVTSGDNMLRTLDPIDTSSSSLSISPRSASASTLSTSSLSTSTSTTPVGQITTPSGSPSAIAPSAPSPIISPVTNIPSVVPAVTHLAPLKQLSVPEAHREMQLVKSRGKSIQGKIRSIKKEIASLEKKIDTKLRLLDRVKKEEVQKRANAQIDGWQKKIDDLEAQKEKLESILDDLRASFEQLKAATE